MRPAKVRPARRLAAFEASVMLAAALLLLPGSPAAGAVPDLPAPDSFGIDLVNWAPVDVNEPRMLDATMRTPAIFQPRGGTESVDVTVRVYLPAGYRTDPRYPYPVLYLLHGGTGGYQDWSLDGDNGGRLAETLRGSAFNGIVVMPEAGRTGWYTDWYGATNGGFSPQWETFHIGQLVPWVDANFNTTGDRSGRAIAGLSMGGFGALSYAARHTDLFSALGSFSGGTDLTEDGAKFRVAASMLAYGAAIGDTGMGDYRYRVTALADQRVEAVFGPPDGTGDWPAKNPLRLVSTYRAYDAKFGLYSGEDDSVLGSEHELGLWNAEFHGALDAAGVDHRYCHGPGEHDWPYWREDLRDFIGYVYGTTPTTCANGW